MPYNFPPKIERELREFDNDDVGQVADEIRICKLLLRRAVEHGYSSLANSLCATIAKLSATQIANQVRMGQLLESSAVIALSQKLSAAIAMHLESVPNRDAIVDALLADFAEIFQAQKQRPLRLTHEKAVDDNELPIECLVEEINDP